MHQVGKMNEGVLKDLALLEDFIRCASEGSRQDTLKYASRGICPWPMEKKTGMVSLCIGINVSYRPNSTLYYVPNDNAYLSEITRNFSIRANLSYRLLFWQNDSRVVLSVIDMGERRMRRDGTRKARAWYPVQYEEYHSQ